MFSDHSDYCVKTDGGSWGKEGRPGRAVAAWSKVIASSGAGFEGGVHRTYWWAGCEGPGLPRDWDDLGVCVWAIGRTMVPLMKMKKTEEVVWVGQTPCGLH